jgi:hypothetical protein
MGEYIWTHFEVGGHINSDDIEKLAAEIDEDEIRAAIAEGRPAEFAGETGLHEFTGETEMQKHLPAHFEPHIPHGSGDAEYRIIGNDGTILAIVDPDMKAEDPASLAEAMVRAMNAAAIEPEPEMPTPGEGEQVYRVRQLADAYLYYWCYVVAKNPGEALKIASNEDQDWVEDGSSDAFDNRDYEVYRADDEDYNEILDDSYGD